MAWWEGALEILFWIVSVCYKYGKDLLKHLFWIVPMCYKYGKDLLKHLFWIVSMCYKYGKDLLKHLFWIVPMGYEFWKSCMDMNTKRAELESILGQLRRKVKIMKERVQKEEGQLLGRNKKRKKTFDAFLRQVEKYNESSELVLHISQERQWSWAHISLVWKIERHRREGQEHLDKAVLLERQGLTYDENKTRGNLLSLPTDLYLGESYDKILKCGLEAMKDGKSQCIGIYGYTQAGKTTLMMNLHNEIFEDKEGFKAVFWATAPKLDPDHVDYRKALQECVADAMGIQLDNNLVNDEVRNAAKIMARFEQMAPGRAVLFLDNLSKDFPSYDLLGIPGSNGDSMNCILVFTTQSKDVCNKMKCDVALKMDLLTEKEARELFWQQVGLDSVDKKKIQEIAAKVAKQCARMPLAIIMIARSMSQENKLYEWRNRLNELTSTIASSDNTEDDIIKQFEFGYDCLQDKTLPLQSCFVEASHLLANDRQLSKKEIISKWKHRRLIGMDREPKLADDQGHTILNQLERMCLLQVQVVGPGQEAMVTMNKWIRKMATKVSCRS